MNKHTVLKHDSWYQPKRDEFVPIAPEDLERVRARYRGWQSHQLSGQTRVRNVNDRTPMMSADQLLPYRHRRRR